MRDPLHWPPGAPVLFAAGHELFPSAGSVASRDIPAAYWLLAIVSTLTTLLAALLARVLAGPWAGLATAALVGFYPPLILATGEQLSEPLGAMWVTAGILALAVAERDRRWWAYAAAGVLLALAVLTRADLLPAVALVPVLVALWHRRLPAAAAVAAGAALAIAPWTAYASREADELVPVTRGSASALFVGTYLPGGGTTVGMKRDLEDEVWRRNPNLRGRQGMDIEARVALAVIADRHPELDRNAAIAKEARRNLVRYGLGDPLAFGQMLLDKGIQRMWSRYSRGGSRPTSPVIRTWHVLLVILGFSGLLCGLRARRDLALAAVLLLAATGTAVHMLVVSQARYNLPLMPVVVAGGVAGVVFVLRRLRAEPAASGPSGRVPDTRAGAVPVGIAR
jgi:hypothetical protein